MTAARGDAAAGLAAASELGGFFEVGGAVGGDGGWVPLVELLQGSGEALRARIDSTRAVMAASARISVDEIDHKAAASVVQLGLVSRLMAPALASAALTGWVPQLDLERVWWKPQTNNPVPIAVPSAVGRFASEPVELGAVFEVLVLNTGVSSITEAVLGLSVPTVSPQVLWGNVASGLVGAMSMLSRARTDLAERAGELVGGVLAGARLNGAGEFTADGFRRHSCCLFYRVPGAGLCGDCVLLAQSG